MTFSTIPASTASEKPATVADKKLSVKHLSQSVHYNMQHAKDHLKQEKVAKAKLNALIKRKK